jgi:hypothetical protein
MSSPADHAPTWAPLDGTADALTMFSIYRHPIDFPDRYVVRRSFVLPSGEVAHDVVPRLADDLEGARALVPPALYRQERFEGDAPQIVEVWF